MRRNIFCLALSVALTGSLAGPAMSKSNTPKRPIPPHVAKECAAYVTKDNPRYKIVGPFSHASFRSSISNFFAEGRVLVIAAPLILGPSKGYAGCIYDIRDGAFVFRQTASINQFPARTERAPGDPP